MSLFCEDKHDMLPCCRDIFQGGRILNMAASLFKTTTLAGLRDARRICAVSSHKLYKFTCQTPPMRSSIWRRNKPLQCRTMCTEPPKKYDFVKESSKRGPIRWTGLVVTVIVGGAAVYYVKQAKEEMEKKREAEKKRSIGKAAIGGPFTLVNHEGKTVTNKDFLGQWLILYFGFTHCPDICPDTLEKLHKSLDKIDNTKDVPDRVLPIFITVDPGRDDVKTVAEYIKDFHPRLVGLTGTDEQVKATCKVYRVYYSAGPADADNDYIVDHSVILYLVNPDGDFVDYFGQNMDENEIANTTISHMLKYKLTNK